MKNRQSPPKRRSPFAACLSHGAYRPKRVPSALQKAKARREKPKHRRDFARSEDFL